MKSENWISALIWDLILKILDIHAIFEQIPEIDFFFEIFSSLSGIRGRGSFNVFEHR